MKRTFIVAAACLALLASGFVATAADGAPVQLKIIAQQPGTSFYTYATSLVRMLDESLPAGSTVEVIPRGAAIANPSTLDAGRGDVAMSLSCAAAWAYQGETAVYPNGKHKNIRGVTGGMHLSYNMVMIRKAYAQEKNITTLKQALDAGARVAMKPMGSVVIPIAEVILRNYGLSLEALRAKGLLTQAQPSQIGEMLRDGRVDLYIENVPLNHPSVTEITLTNDLVFLTIDDKILAELAAMGMPEITMDVGSYRGMDKPYRTNVTGMVILANVNADENAVYILTKVIVEGQDELAGENAALKYWDPKAGSQPDMIPVPLHPGAAKYYRERGWIK